VSDKGNTFFVSNSLTGRLSETSLENQSEEYQDYEYVDDLESGPTLQCVLTFEGSSSILSTASSITMSESIDELTLGVSDEISVVSELLLKRAPLESVTFYDAKGTSIANFDLEEKSYKSLTTWCNESENYQVRLIFI
tara:strand:+ start:489 stop:902 length:414 start_codon:yes stop_codon:yes gene_type:complete